jgi:hypothetical protein
VSLLVGELKALLGLDTSKFDHGMSSSESKFRQHGKRIGSQSEQIAKQAGNGLGRAERSSFRLTGAMGRLSGVAGRASIGLGGLAKTGGIIGIALSAAGGAIIGAGMKVADYGGKLDLLKKKSATVFGGELGRVQTWAKANAHAMGLTKGEATGLAAGLADLLIPMGFTRKAAADMATKTTGLAGALAEWSGGTKTAAEVTDILSASFMGERDGLNALGISITQAEVDAELMRKGQDKLTGAQKQQAEATATQALIMAKSKDAQTAYANGAGSLARQQALARARLKEMGETLATKATPMLLAVATAVNTHVLPALERFGAWANENRFQIASVFVAMAQAVVGLVKIVGPAMKIMTNASMAYLNAMINGAAKAFGWVPELGPKLKAARDQFNSFRDGTNKAFDAVIKKANEWDDTLGKTQKELKIKADIVDLETKLKKARAQLGDKNLTKTRKAQITASITSLEYQLRLAKGKLADPALTKSRIAKLTANKTELDYRIRAARQALDSPKLTATKRAKLTAYIGELQRQVNAAQAKINSLRGKTVVIRYTATGVNLTAPSTVGRRQHGGPVGALRPYLVGERGPEMFVPKTAGVVVPNTRLNTSPRGSAGGGDIRVVLELRSSGSRHDDLLVQQIAGAVRVRGGNAKILGIKS